MKVLRNVALVMALLVFAFGILGTSIWQTAAQSVSESYQVTQAGEEGKDESAPEQAAEATVKEAIDYALPYPGILPNHLLYPLKMIRDRIWLFLTTDSLKKAELYLLFADKRLGASKALIEGEQLDLGLETLTKAEKYLEQAINQEEASQKAGKDTKALLERLSWATQKHEEIILSFEERITTNARPAYDSAFQYSREGYNRVMKRMGK